MKITINDHVEEYDSCAHFERLCREMSWTLADEIVDLTAQRLINASSSNPVSLTALRRIGAGPGATWHIKCRNIGTAAARVDRCNDVHMVDTVRQGMFT